MDENNMVTFDDLLMIRKGDKEKLTMGRCESYVDRIKSKDEWKIKAKALREIFYQTLGQPSFDIDCELEPEIVSEEKFRGVIKRTVLFNVEPDERIEAYVLLPENIKNQCAAIICLHPTTSIGKEQTIGNGSTPEDYDRAYGLHLAQKGYITIAFDQLSAGTRCYKGLKPFDNAPFYEKHPNWSAVGKNIHDTKRTVDFLCSMEEVDSNRIACIGHSQGAGITIQTMAVDERIKVGVSSCGGFPARLSKNPFNHARTGWWIGQPYLRPYCWSAKQFPVDLHELIALAAPRAFMHIAALNDCMYSLNEVDMTRYAFENLAENVKQIFALYKADDKFVNVLHTNGHSFIKEQRDIAYNFLQQMLL